MQPDGLRGLPDNFQIRKWPIFRRSTFTHGADLIARQKECHCFVSRRFAGSISACSDMARVVNRRSEFPV